MTTNRPEYIICYTVDGDSEWEFAYGEDEMQIRVDELMREIGVEDIMVFYMEDQLE